MPESNNTFRHHDVVRKEVCLLEKLDRTQVFIHYTKINLNQSINRIYRIGAINLAIK